MTRWLILAGLAGWAGGTLLLSELPWFSRPSLTERLRPYVLGEVRSSRRRSVLSAESFREALGPAASLIGDRLTRLLGVVEDLEVRLARVHSPLDPTAFRIRQVGAATAGFAVGGFIAIAFRSPLPIGMLFTVGMPLLAFLLVEQNLATASRRWQRRVFLELPIVAEQLAMLLSAGFSLTAALNRVAGRGSGACAADLRRVATRVRYGLSEEEALVEWAGVVNVPAVDRLVTVLALNRQTTDLGRLLSEEARNVRRDVQRELTEHVERRGQQVWIPVTVATLVPGVIFLSVPFMAALQVFAR